MANVQYYECNPETGYYREEHGCYGREEIYFLVHPEANKTMIKEAVEKNVRGSKSKNCQHHEFRWQDKKTRNDLRQNSKNQKSCCYFNRGQQGYRNLRGTLISP